MADIIESLRSMTEPAGFHSYHDNGVRILEMTCKPNSTAHEAADEIISLRAERDASKALCDEMAKALEPFTRLEIPKKPQGNAGAYSIRHADIAAAIRSLAKAKEADHG